jgi:hypothetical protein
MENQEEVKLFIEEEPIAEEIVEEGIIEFTTCGEYISSAYFSLAAVDDIDTAIKNYFNDLVDILCFTPFNYYLSNIKKRIESPDTSMQIDVSDTNAGIYQYIKWFKSVENAWKIDNYKQGRLVICDDVCGQKQ